jgi:hypothetical protein
MHCVDVLLANKAPGRSALDGYLIPELALSPRLVLQLLFRQIRQPVI